MRVEIISPHGDLKREVWTFSLDVGYNSACIYFDGYSFQIKDSTRHKKWISQTHWERLFRRNNNIECPPLPADAENEMRTIYQAFIMIIPIRK